MATVPTRPNPFVQAGSALLRGLPTVAPTFLVVAILACVLVPLPTPLVDLLLSLSLAGSVLLLVGSLTIGRASEFSNFPALLLLATLFRLALNVSTTRLILSQADAGQVVDAFASIVVREDLIVGGVMFAIITIVQFGVIARGAERVAEVAARFALDGLPGHQAAIDADLRAGVISAREASRRRAELAERSSFYGAMDGAIRFVKGDAVAGLAITAVNLVGGLAIGAGRQGLGWGESLSLYGQLTIGDGLLAQIPALLVSLAAGLLVARVDQSGEAEERSTVRWLQPAMLIVPAALLLGLAAIPGMPQVAFLATGIAVFSVAVALSLRRLASAGPNAAADSQDSVLVRVHPTRAGERGELERALAQLRRQCASSLGIGVPRIELSVSDPLPKDGIEIVVQGRALPRTSLEPSEATEGIVLRTFRAVMDAAPTLVDLQVLDRMLEKCRQTHPVVVQRALGKVEPEDVLSIVRAFLRERTQLPPLHIVLGLLAEDRRFHDRTQWGRAAEHARVELRDHWLHAEVTGLRGLGPLRVVRLTPDAEVLLCSVVVESEGGLVAQVSPAQRAGWVEAIRSRAAEGKGALVLVSTARHRPHVAALVRGVTPRIPVLSVDEMEHAGAQLTGPWLDVDDLDA
ncbi:MAG: FHIPEP family type III secretion protein [Nannocystaceae bacterium]|nr:flagellar biosynthesis protein FlhA [bacterium]